MSVEEKGFDVRSWAEGFQHQFQTFVDGFKEDMRQRDDQIKTIVQQQSRITENVSKLTGQVEHLSEGQRGVFSRMNRPWQWTLVASIFLGMFTMFGAFATVLTLTVTPIKDQMRVHNEYEMRFRNSTDQVLTHLNGLISHNDEEIQHVHVEQARLEERSRWLEKSEQRNYEYHVTLLQDAAKENAGRDD